MSSHHREQSTSGTTLMHQVLYVIGLFALVMAATAGSGEELVVKGKILPAVESTPPTLNLH